MHAILILLLCFSSGILLKQIYSQSEKLAVVFRKIIIYICLPAVIFDHIPNITWSSDVIYPMAMPWIFFLTSAIFFKLLQRPLGLSKKTMGCLILMAGMGNTSFVGFPMIEAFYGKHALQTGILVDLPGSFVLLSSIGLVTAVHFSGERLSLKEFATRLLSFAPIWFFVMALLIGHWELSYPDYIKILFHFLGALLSPLALISIGLQIKLGHWEQYKKELSVGLMFKLLLGPLLMTGILWGLWGATGEVLQVTLFESAMPPMVSAGILALEHHVEPDLAALMIGVGIPISFITLPIAWYAFSFL